MSHVFAPNILSMISDQNPRVRNMALTATERIHRQGFVLPGNLVAPLIAATTDSHYEIARKTQILLGKVKKADSTYVSTKMMDGVKLSYGHQLKIKHNDPSSVVGYKVVSKQNHKESLLNFCFKMLSDKSKIKYHFLVYLVQFWEFLPVHLYNRV